MCGSIGLRERYELGFKPGELDDQQQDHKPDDEPVNEPHDKPDDKCGDESHDESRDESDEPRDFKIKTHGFRRQKRCKSAFSYRIREGEPFLSGFS